MLFYSIAAILLLVVSALIVYYVTKPKDEESFTDKLDKIKYLRSKQH